MTTDRGGEAQNDSEDAEAKRRNEDAEAKRRNEDAEILRLAALSKRAYESEREDAAKRLGWRVGVLDQEVARESGEYAPPDGQGRPLDLPEPEPWPEAVDGAALLREIVAAILRYVVMAEGAAEIVALWVLHTHALDAFGISPRLAITSPRPGCGKTTLLDILYLLIPRPLLAANVTAAAIFRTIEVSQASLLLDEGDSFLRENDELRGILNAGHRRGGNVIRIVGDDNAPRQFATWGACAIAMIGKLPETLHLRSVLIALKRKRPDETVEQFRFDRTDALDVLAGKAARWAKDNISRVSQMDPIVPEGLDNRPADNWRPLLAIADAAGGDWPARVREIAVATVDADATNHASLLADIRAIFDERQVLQIASAGLVEALVLIEGHPWAEYRHGRPLTVNGLARLLARDGIRPATIRLGKPKHVPGDEVYQEIARRQVEYLKQAGVEKIVRHVATSHSWPPRDPPAGES
jgi:uncharacterized protein DUF3631